MSITQGVNELTKGKKRHDQWFLLIRLRIFPIDLADDDNNDVHKDASVSRSKKPQWFIKDW